jgi:putative NADH-flavin reductase
MITKKIALFGTDESLVRRVAVEALVRGHKVTAIVPKPEKLNLNYSKFHVVQGNMMDHGEVTKHAHGHDVVICLHEPDLHHPKIHIKANRAVIIGARNAGIDRIISLGHPISIKPEKNKAFFDKWKAVADAQHATHNLFKNEDWLRWEYLHSSEHEHAPKAIKAPFGHEIYLSNPEGTGKVLHVNRFIDALLEEAEKTEFIWHEDEIVF